MKHLFIMLTGLFFGTSFPATYYVSISGSDSYTALQSQNPATPWQSLTKVNATVFAPGDSVLFKRGESWSGTLRISSSGTAGNPIVYSAYGTGANPQIKGTRLVTGGWSAYSGSIHQADFTGPVVALFMDGKPMPLARTPNAGYWTIDTVLNTTTLRCDTANAVNWSGARAHIRTEHWTLASKTVTACVPSPLALTLDAAPVYDLRAGWGFFLNNALAALDTAGEWFYDASAHKVYFRTPDNSAPAAHTIEVSVDSFGIYLYRKSHVTVSGFTLFGQKVTAIWVAGGTGTGITISDNEALYPDVTGIYVFEQATHYTLARNTIIGANTYGIHTYGNNFIIEDNTIRAIATFSRFTASGMSDGCCSGLGIEASGANLAIRGNRIDSIGYIGIRNSNGSAVMERNYITNCCVTKDDGGGIYCGWQFDTNGTGIAGTVIRNNIVLYTRSANAGTPDPGYFPGQGIYIDDYGHDITIEGNTAAHCADNGLFLHNTRRIRVSNNTFFNNNKKQAAYGENSYSDRFFQMADNILIGNRMISLTPAQSPFSASSNFPTSDFGDFDSNSYWNPFTRSVISYRNTPYTLSQWQSTFGQDLNSTCAPVRWNPWIVRDTLSSEMIINGRFTTDAAGWGIWPNTCAVSRDTGHSMDGGCLKVRSPWDGANQPIVVSNTYKLQKDHKYLLKFSVTASRPGSIVPVVRQSNSPWATVASSAWVSMGPEREDYEMLFIPTVNDSPCRIDFNPAHPDTLFWLDNVSLHEVTADSLMASERVFLFMNPASHDSTILLSAGLKKLDGAPAPGALLLAPFTSEVYYSEQSLAAEAGQRPLKQKLLSAFPNPFNPSITLTVHSSLMDERIRMEVFNITGRKVADLSAGLVNGSVRWNAALSPSGIYLVKCTSKNGTYKIKITLVK